MSAGRMRQKGGPVERGMGFRLCQGTGGLAETCALDVPAEPGLGRTHKT